MIVLADIFKSGMTLQREKEVKIWGRTDKKQSIKVSVNGEKAGEALCDKGEFSIKLRPQNTMTDAVISIKGEEEDYIELENVDFGEVWIAGGQSNMEFLMKWETNYLKGEEENQNNYHIRFYEVPKYAFEGEEKDHFKDDQGYGVWRTCCREDIPYFSAVGYYFAQKIEKDMQVPTAVIGCNWGGTVAAAWMDEELIKRDKDLKHIWKEYEDGLKKMNLANYEGQDLTFRKNTSTAQMRNMNEQLMLGKTPAYMRKLIGFMAKLNKTVIGPHSENRPGGLYHTMLGKIAGYTCRGVIWYQGESDTENAGIYDKLFAKVIECWRRDWAEEIPFLYVQLAPFDNWVAFSGKKFPELRACQERVTSMFKNVGMVSIMDDGLKNDIHPKNKKIVGERLALLAEGEVYGKNILCNAP